MVENADENGRTQNSVVAFGRNAGTRGPDHPGSDPACGRGNLEAKRPEDNVGYSHLTPNHASDTGHAQSCFPG